MTALAGIIALVGAGLFIFIVFVALRGALLWFWRITDILIEFQGLRQRLDETNRLLGLLAANPVPVVHTPKIVRPPAKEVQL